MIERKRLKERIEFLWNIVPAVLLVGPRQCGKTTLARSIAKDHGGTVFDMENPVDRAALADPYLTLRALTGLIVIDEIQHVPSLFEVIRVLVDAEPNARTFLFLGSASFRLLNQSSESLTGRCITVEMQGLSVDELPETDIERLWLRGGMPRSFLATSDEASVVWRNAYLASVLERDLPAHGIRTPATTLRRMWTMVAHYHTSSLNLAALSRSLDVAPQTVRGFLDVLTDAMLIRQLQPWHANIGKRQRKTPKLLIRDSGLYHVTLGITNDVQLSTHPNKGASWEAFALEHVLAMMQPTEAYTWATHQGAELDLLMVHNGKRIGVEIKFTSQPRRTASMQQAIVDLELDSVLVVYPGAREFAIAENIAAVPLHQIRPLATW